MPETRSSPRAPLKKRSACLSPFMRLHPQYTSDTASSPTPNHISPNTSAATEKPAAKTPRNRGHSPVTIPFTRAHSPATPCILAMS